MVRNLVHSEFLPIEERIRRAGAERSVEVGYAIGSALAALSNTARSVFEHAAHRSSGARGSSPLIQRVATRR